MKKILSTLFCIILILKTFGQVNSNELNYKINKLTQENEQLKLQLLNLQKIFQDTIVKQNIELRKVFLQLNTMQNQTEIYNSGLSKSVNNIVSQSYVNYWFVVGISALMLILLILVSVFFYLKWNKLKILEKKSEVNLFNAVKNDQTTTSLSLNESMMPESKILTAISQNNQLIIEDLANTREFMLKLLSRNNLSLLEEFNGTKETLLKILNSNMLVISEQLNATKDFLQTMSAQGNQMLLKDFDNTREFLLQMVRTQHRSLVEEFEVTKELVIQRVSDNNNYIDKEITRTIDAMDKEFKDVKRIMDKDYEELKHKLAQKKDKKDKRDTKDKKRDKV